MQSVLDIETLPQGKSDVVIALFVGGGNKTGATDLTLVGADFGFQIDVMKELDGTFSPDPHVIQLELVGGTAADLLKRFERDPRYARICAALSDDQADLSTGLAQTGPVGAMAWDTYPRIETQWELALNLVRKISGGSPVRVKIVIMGSGSGGTGKGILLKAGSSLAKYLGRSLDCIIVEQYVILGSQTFNNLGNHIGPNHATAMVEFAAHILAKADELKNVRQGLVYELPMVEEKGLVRDMYARYALQAVLSQQAQEQLGRKDCNQQFGNAWNRLTTVDLAFRIMPQHINPTASAAMILVPMLQEIMDQNAGSKLTPKVELSVTTSLTRAGLHDDLVGLAKAKGHLTPDWWDRFVEIDHVSAIQVFAVLSQSTKFPISNLLQQSLPRSVEEYLERKGLLNKVLSGIRDEMTSAEAVITTSNRQIAKFKKAIVSKINMLFPETVDNLAIRWGYRFVGAMSGRAKAILQLKSLLGSYKSLQEVSGYNKAKKNLDEAQARLKALTEAKAQIEKAVRYMEDQLKQVMDWLIVESREEGGNPKLFTFKNINQVFSSLAAARATNVRSRFQTVILSTIKGVTKEGLCVIVSVSESADIMELAQALPKAHGVPDQDGRDGKDSPVACGKQRGGRLGERLMLSIPPVDKILRDQIVQALSDVKQPYILLETDAITMATVTMRAHYVEELDDWLSHQLKRDLEMSEANGDSLIRWIPGNPGWKQLLGCIDRIANQRKRASKRVKRVDTKLRTKHVQARKPAKKQVRKSQSKTSKSNKRATGNKKALRRTTSNSRGKK